MSEAPLVEPLDTHARITLRGWLGDAARLGIDIDSAESIQEAYERYFDEVLATAEDEREDPTARLTTIAMAMGEHFRRNSRVDWALVTDEQGKDLALFVPSDETVLFPIDPIADSWANQEREWLQPFIEAALDMFRAER